MIYEISLPNPDGYYIAPNDEEFLDGPREIVLVEHYLNKKKECEKISQDLKKAKSRIEYLEGIISHINQYANIPKAGPIKAILDGYRK